MPIRRDNPYANFNFTVDIGAGDELGFSEADLPSGEIEVIEYREGADRTNAARKLPGRVSYPRVVLRRGLAGRLELFDWWKAARDGQVDRRNVRITLLDEARAPVQTWRLRNAWPTKLSSSPLNARGNEVVIESLELAHEGFETE
ncbi:MAG: phage tail protein [Actinobacteria bacterium]|nr:phage tail protein [Actinomycetota bacterium]